VKTPATQLNRLVYKLSSIKLKIWNLKLSDFKGISSSCKIEVNWLSEHFVQGDICVFAERSSTASLVHGLFTFEGNWKLSYKSL